MRGIERAIIDYVDREVIVVKINGVGKEIGSERRGTM